MSLKNALLAAATLAVLGLGVYLFIQVRATPAQASATQVSARPPEPARAEHVSEPSAPAAEERTERPRPGSTRTSWEARRKTDSQPSLASSDDDNRQVDLKLDNLMELANKAYDAQDFDQATAIAGKVLSKDPNNVRMLRIMVSANCIQGDSAVAQEHYERLPEFDRNQMRIRCDRYGVSFKEP